MSPLDLQEAARQLLPGRPATVQDGQVRVRSGVRALPPRTGEGSMPIAGQLPGDEPRFACLSDQLFDVMLSACCAFEASKF